MFSFFKKIFFKTPTKIVKEENIVDFVWEMLKEKRAVHVTGTIGTYRKFVRNKLFFVGKPSLYKNIILFTVASSAKDAFLYEINFLESNF